MFEKTILKTSQKPPIVNDIYSGVPLKPPTPTEEAPIIPPSGVCHLQRRELGDLLGALLGTDAKAATRPSGAAQSVGMSKAAGKTRTHTQG